MLCKEMPHFTVQLQESGADIMGMSADDLRNLEQSESEFSLAVQAATFKQLLFKLKIAEENYNDENRIKMSVVRCGVLHLLYGAKGVKHWHWHLKNAVCFCGYSCSKCTV